MLRGLVAAVVLALLLSPVVYTQQQEEVDQELVDFLVKNEIRPEQSDRVLKATLMTIVSSSKKMVVTTDKTDKTLVLALVDKFAVKNGKKDIEAKDLKRGDRLVLILQSDGLKVKEIHKFR